MIHVIKREILIGKVRLLDWYVLWLLGVHSTQWENAIVVIVKFTHWLLQRISVLVLYFLGLAVTLGF
jgi:hypothetical protein